MRDNPPTAERLAAYSDAVFAVIVTIMVLQLELPEEPTFAALGPLWPTALSYAISYLFIAIIWSTHHYLWRFVGTPTPGLIWINFASSPVVCYDGLFVAIDLVYNGFERHVLAWADPTRVPARTRRWARRRSLVALTLFTLAMVVAFAAPVLGVALICGALLFHVRPEAPGSRP